MQFFDKSIFSVSSRIFERFSGSVRINTMIRLKTRTLRKWMAIARQAGFKVREMSQILGISQKQLQRNIHRLFGLNPLHWLKKQRLTLAARLLKRRHSVKMIFYKLGFKQHSHFSREFKLFHGLTPTQFLARSFKKRLRTRTE